MMENLQKYVSSRGIMKSIDFHNANPISSSAAIDESLLGALEKKPITIYINTDALENFSRNYLARIDYQFTLVSGDSDTSVDEKILVKPEIKNLLNKRELVRWFAQNLLIDKDERLYPIPIGIDYHTMYERPGLWGVGQSNPFSQEARLIQCLSESPPPNERIPIAYCNWHFQIERGDRQQCYESTDKDVCYYEPAHLPRYTSWYRQSRFFFVLSPRGAGFDCHRTWEAIMLGLVPIIKKGPLSRLYQGLPVYEVVDWSEISRKMLLEVANDMLLRKYDYSTVYGSNWAGWVRGKLQPAPLLLTLAEYRSMHRSINF